MAMRLSGFILENIEPIVREWTDFARTLSTLGEPLDTTELRDHVEQMLRAIATDLQMDQSLQQQVDKSQGHAVSHEDTAAKIHAITRLMSGFTIDRWSRVSGITGKCDQAVDVARGAGYSAADRRHDPLQ